MNEVNSIDTSIFPGTPTCATNGNDIAPKFLTMMVIAHCRTACEEFADSLGSSPCEEHDIINDCLASCDEYASAAARESRHAMRYAIWCSERCDELRDTCIRTGGSAAKSAEKWLKAVSKQINREVISWQRVNKTAAKNVSWNTVKNTTNRQVIAFDPFGSLERSKASGDK